MFIEIDFVVSIRPHWGRMLIDDYFYLQTFEPFGFALSNTAVVSYIVGRFRTVARLSLLAVSCEHIFSKNMTKSYLCFDRTFQVKSLLLILPSPAD